MLVFYKQKTFYFAVSQIIYSFLASLLITVGYLVTPVLFASLDVKAAGDIAGDLFVISGYISLILLAILLSWQMFLRFSYRSYWHNGLALILLASMLWFISPWMKAIKENYPLGLHKDAIDWPVFATLHGVYQLAYLLVIIMLIWAMLKATISLKVLADKR